MDVCAIAPGPNDRQDMVLLVYCQPDSTIQMQCGKVFGRRRLSGACQEESGWERSSVALT
jgi:hypothetical protein